MTDTKKRYIENLVTNGTLVQVGLRATGAPIGPGKLEHVKIDGEICEGMYRMQAQAQFQENAQARQKMVLLPMVFSIEDIAVIVEPPRNMDGSAIETVTPRSIPGRTPGGLIIPGGAGTT